MESNINQTNLKNLNKRKRTFDQCLKQSKTNTSCEQTRFNIEKTNASYVYSSNTYYTNEEKPKKCHTNTNRSSNPCSSPNPGSSSNFNSCTLRWDCCNFMLSKLIKQKKNIKYNNLCFLSLRSDEECGKLKNNSLNVSTILS